LLEALDREVRRHGRGGIRRLERALGKKKSWWQERVNTGHITTDQFLAVCQFLGLSPSRFIKEALGPEEDLGLHLPWREPPEIIQRAWERFHDETPKGAALGADFFQTLDTMRYEAPQRVVEMGLEMVAWTPREKLPHLLGVVGSAWRLMCELEIAAHAIYAAIQMARQLGDHQEYGQLLQRLAYVYAEKPELESALLLAEQATLVHLRAGNKGGAAKTLVDQGIWLHYLGRWNESNATEIAALEWLPENERHNRAAAYLILALNQLKHGRPDDAHAYVDRAEKESIGVSVIERSRATWIRGLIFEAQGDFERAVEKLKAVLELWSSVYLGNMALIACDLARVYLRMGHAGAAYQTALCLRQLLDPLRKNRIASSAVAALLRDGESITLALVQEVQSKIESELRKRQWSRLLWIKGR
jgi:tetratricopeptide (TPR) repeat protein